MSEDLNRLSIEATGKRSRTSSPNRESGVRTYEENKVSPRIMIDILSKHLSMTLSQVHAAKASIVAPFTDRESYVAYRSIALLGFERLDLTRKEISARRAINASSEYSVSEYRSQIEHFSWRINSIRCEIQEWTDKRPPEGTDAREKWSQELEQLTEQWTLLATYRSELHHPYIQPDSPLVETETMISNSANERVQWLSRAQAVTIHDDIDYDMHAKYSVLPRNIIARTGLEIPRLSESLVLFKRRACEDEVKFICKIVESPNRDGFIFGQPGTGKSTTAFTTAMSLRETWKTIWIHVGGAYDLRYIAMIKGGEILKWELSRGSPELLRLHLFESFPRENIIVMIDSFNPEDSDTLIIVSTARLWVSKSPENRRFIGIASSAATHKVKLSERGRFEEHLVGSWCLSEYYEAIRDNNFWRSVQTAFTDQTPSGKLLRYHDRKKIVDQKYFYGGNCARFMFNYSVAEVKMEIRRILRSVRCEGAGSPAISNNLISASVDMGVLRMTGFLSEYVSLVFGIYCGARYVREIASSALFLSNSSALGWIFEGLFFALASDSPTVTATLRTQTIGKSSPKIRWTCAPDVRQRVVEFQPQSFETVEVGVWLMPDTPRQPGYDAVMLTKDGLIRFVQTTIAMTHDLKMGALADLVKRLRSKNYTVKNAEIFFVIPDSGNSNNFSIGPLQNWRRFSDLFDTWPKKHDAVKAKLQIVMIPFIAQEKANDESL